MVRIIKCIAAPILVLVFSVFAVGLARGWDNMGWLFAWDNVPHYFSNFDFTSGNIDTWIVMVPILLGAVILVFTIVSAIRSQEWMRLIFGIVTAASTVLATFVYSSAPAPITWLPGVLCYLAILFSLAGQFILIRRFER